MNPLGRVRSATIGVAVVLAASAVLAGCGGGGDGGGVDYAATDLRTGEPVSVESLAGRPAVLVSWATWCKECDEVLEELQDFAGSSAAEDVAVVAVNLDAADVEDDIDAKIERHGLTTELWRDRRNEYKRTFGALGVPTTVVLDADGEVVLTHPGAVDFDAPEVQDALREVGAEP